MVIYLIKKDGCAGIDHQESQGSQGSRRQPKWSIGNAVEPGDEKSRAKTTDGKKKK